MNDVETRQTLLTGGILVDGSGHTAGPQSILFDSKGIVARGPDADAGHAGATNVVDIAGAHVFPGFIDSHVHAEAPLWDSGAVPAALAQGITTLIIGQDGCSWAPTNADTMDFMNGYFGAVNGTARHDVRDSFTVRELLDGLDERAVQNVGYLAPHGNLRMLADPVSTTALRGAGLDVARGHLRTALHAGALGMSSGFDYVPSAYGDLEEIVALAAELRAFDVPYVSHLRGYGDAVRSGLEELIAVGEQAGVRVHASHLRGPYEDIAELLADAAKRGVELTFDMYPYTSSSTTLLALLLPMRLQQPSVPAMLDALHSADARAALASQRTRNRLSSLRITFVDDPELSRHEGDTLIDAARTHGMDVVDFAVHLLQTARLGVCVQNHGHDTTDEQLTKLIGDDRHCAGSDGIYTGRHPHPRGFGAVVKLLETYSEDATDGLSRAARHLAENAASLFRLPGRGRLVPGFAADIAVCRLDALRDNASSGSPPQPASGVDRVYVNGELVFADGRLTGRRPGRALRNQT